MFVLNTVTDPGNPDTVIKTVECDREESLVAIDVEGFYEINGMVFSGHDVGVMRRVCWDARAQEWKVPKP